MGRITIFTGDDLHSNRVKASLTSRSLPFTEIRVQDHPDRRKELTRLVGGLGVPHVFFNTRYIGGVTGTIEELEKWDEKTKEFNTPLDRYKKLIDKFCDPVNKVFALPDTNPADIENQITAVDVLVEPVSIKLPDGTKTSVRDITHRLSNTLPLGDNKYKYNIHKKSFTGQTALETFKGALHVADSDGIAFGQHLLEERLIEPLTARKTFLGAEKELYRLQCNMKPDILNSNRIWTEPSNPTCSELFEHLDAIMARIENDSINAKNGKLDHVAVKAHKKYSIFEDAICELQVVSPTYLESKERVAFGLNIYNLMMKYAFIKVGVPESEAAFNSLVNKVKFNIGGKVFTFNQWEQDLIRPSCRLWEPQFEKLVPLVTHCSATMGSTVSPLFRKYTVDNLLEELVHVGNVFFEDETNFSINRKTGDAKLSKVLNRGKRFPKKPRLLLEEITPLLSTAKRWDVSALLERDTFQVTFVDVQYSRNACEFVPYNETSVKPHVKRLSAMLLRYRKPSNEKLRLDTLYKLSILDTLPEERFDRITRMLKADFNVPMSFITIIDEERLWVKSKQWSLEGAPPPELPRSETLCSHTILLDDDDVLWIEEAHNDDRFMDLPIIKGTGSRFYAGSPICIPTENGEYVNIGALCVMSREARMESEEEVEILKSYTRQVQQLLTPC